MPMEPAAGTEPAPDYLFAQRSAALKLTGKLPTFEQQEQLRRSSDPEATYRAQIERYLSEPAFAVQQMEFWRRTFRMAGTRTVQIGASLISVNMDTAPALASMLVVRDEPITKLLTSTSDTCVQYKSDPPVFTPAPCANVTTAAGVLTDPGALARNYGLMAFRRVRWIQETFLCKPFPVERSEKKEARSGGTYESPWPFESISGSLVPMNKGRVEFHQPYRYYHRAQSDVCANCHSTINHVAPLLGNFDAAGRLQPTVQVQTAAPGEPTTIREDWLPESEQTAWRYGKPAAGLGTVTALIAADPDFLPCMAFRVWSWLLSRGDPVEDAIEIPDSLRKELADEIRGSQGNIKMLIRRIVSSGAFVQP